MTILDPVKKITIQNQLRQTGYLHLERGSLWLICTAIQKTESVSRPV